MVRSRRHKVILQLTNMNRTNRIVLTCIFESGKALQRGAQVCGEDLKNKDKNFCRSHRRARNAARAQRTQRTQRSASNARHATHHMMEIK